MSTERQQRAFAQFTTAGYSKEGAAALVGNASQESGPALKTYFAPTQRDHGSNGIFQWRLERLDALIAFCEERGLHSGTLAAQIQFAIYELGKDYPQLDTRLRHSGDLVQLTQEVCWQYLRPAMAAANVKRREAYAADVLNHAKIETNAKGGAIIAAGSAASSAAIFAQAGPPIAALLLLVAAIAILVVISAALRGREDAPHPEEPQSGVSKDEERAPSGAAADLEAAIEEFNRAAARLASAEAAVLAEVKERQDLLALIPRPAIGRA